MDGTVTTRREGQVLVVTIDRPEVRNAVDPATARRLAEVFVAFDADDDLGVAVLTGAGGTFCAGADLRAVSDGTFRDFPVPTPPLDPHDGSAPMGPSYLQLSKPVIAAVAGHAVAGGLELAVWCDLRVVEEDAVFGVFCRRWGVPLIDGGTVRLPRLIGQSHAMDMILTGRPVGAEEAARMGLANRVVATGTAVEEAVALAQQLLAFPQTCLRTDRASVLGQWGLPFEEAMAAEAGHGRRTLTSGETVTGATRFADGHGRGGSFDDL